MRMIIITVISVNDDHNENDNGDDENNDNASHNNDNGKLKGRSQRVIFISKTRYTLELPMFMPKDRRNYMEIISLIYNT